MAAEKGRDVEIQIGNAATAEAFTSIGGMRSSSLRINNELVDVSDKDSAGKRELLAAAGIQSLSMTGAGVYKATTPESDLREAALNETMNNYRFVNRSDGSYWEGAFLVSNYEESGEHNGARMFSGTFESSGAVTYTASP